MNVEYINPFLDATINMFDKTFGIVPEAGKPFIVEKSAAHRWDVSGVMVLTGKVLGVVVHPADPAPQLAASSAGGHRVFQRR